MILLVGQVSQPTDLADKETWMSMVLLQEEKEQIYKAHLEGGI